MTMLDANLLVYAYNKDVSEYRAASNWLTDLLDSNERIGLPWITIWAFLRVCTNARLWNNPRSPLAAFQIIDEWIAQPAVVLLQPGPRHWDILKPLIADGRAVGPSVTDAALAALAIENGAVLASTDRGFSRFRELRWVNPLENQPIN